MPRLEEASGPDGPLPTQPADRPGPRRGTHWRPFLVLRAGGAVPIGRRARWAGRLAAAVAGQLDRWLRVEQRVPADEPVDMVWVAFGPTATHAAGAGS